MIRSQKSFMNVLLAKVALSLLLCTGCGKASPNTSTMLVVSNGVIVVDTREKIRFDGLDYNNYLLELRSAAEKGADSKFTLHVVDQDGKEVADAEVEVLFPFNGRRGNTLSGKTDAHGLFLVEDKTTGEPSFIVMKKGYYRTTSTFGVFKIGTRCLQNGRWIPWDPKFEVTLKEIRKPVPMIVKRVESKLPKFDVPVGFDFKAGDWVAPYGKGIIADMILTYSEIEREDSWSKYDFKVEFPAPAGGAYIKKKDTYSELGSSHEATEEAYSSCLSFVYERTDSKIIQDIKIAPEDYLVFRSRTETDEKGALKTAHYGKIYGPFKFADGRDREVVFYYYFNPTPNDRNLEFDGKNNLLKNSTSRERTYKP